MNNSIVGVQEAKSKLEEAFLAHFKKKVADFDITINLSNGKYAIAAQLYSRELVEALPKEVDGYPVFAGLKEKNMDS